MGRSKGCVNDSCSAHKKKVRYKESEFYCSICGEPLAYVCKDCYTQLPDGHLKYCVRCQAKHADHQDNVMRKAAKIGGGVVAGVGVVVAVGKGIASLINPFK